MIIGGFFWGGETQALTSFSQSINGGPVNLQGTCDLCERFGRFFLLAGKLYETIWTERLFRPRIVQVSQ